MLPEERSSHRKRKLRAKDILSSGLVGIWKDRTDIGDSLEFARRLREDAQKRRV